MTIENSAVIRLAKELTMDKNITLIRLGKELGMDRSNMRKYVLAAGFAPIKIRTPESRGQLTLALSQEDAETIRELRARQGFITERSKQTAIVDGNGWFYIVQLIPKLDPHRVKLGFATNPEIRLKAHQTAAPTAQLIKSWPCDRTWENTAIASVTRIGCDLIANEVFECDDVDALIARCEDFFSIMPLYLLGA